MLFALLRTTVVNPNNLVVLYFSYLPAIFKNEFSTSTLVDFINDNNNNFADNTVNKILFKVPSKQ